MNTQKVVATETVKVIAVNDFNRPFGIEKGKEYWAQKVTKEFTREAYGSYNVKTVETWQSVSYTIGDYNFQGDDFKMAA